MCTCLHMCIVVYRHMSAPASGCQKLLEIFSIALYLVFWNSFFHWTCSLSTQLGCLANELLGSACVWCYWRVPPCLAFSCEQWNVNSVPRPCMVGSLPTAPSPSPSTLVNILFVKQLPKTESTEYEFEELKMEGENASCLLNTYTFT